MFDSSLLTAESLGTFVNVLGLAVPLVISAALLRDGREPFFSYWSASYLLALLAIGGLGLVQPAHYPIWPTIVAVLLYTASSIAMIRAASSLLDTPARPGLLAALAAAPIAIYLGMAVAGQPFANASAALALVNTGAHIQIGLAVLKTWRVGSSRIGGWLGGGLIVTGLWALGFPYLEAHHITWIGFAGAGLAHTLVGTGMAVYLLDRAAVRLRAQHEELQAMARLKADFVANVSHELRTPLTAIKTGTFLLEARLLGRDPQAHELTAEVGAQAAHLAALVDNLLDLQALERGGLAYARATGDVGALVRQALADQDPMFAAKGIRVAVEAPDGLAAPFDAPKLRQALAGVLANAAKFTPADGEVRVVVAKAGDVARIRVSDSGAGIPAELLPTVFSGFRQAAGGKVGKTAGLGLGLALCKAIVEDGHGGKVWAERPEEGGSRFTIDLPLRAS